MSQLKEINDRYYQEAEIVMLATKYGKITLYDYDNLKTLSLAQGNHKGTENTIIPQHLYIVSNEEIKEGDWYVIVQDSKKGYQVATKPASKEEVSLQNKFNCKKIIATTDLSLNKYPLNTTDKNFKDFITLPKPSDSFIKNYIEEYNKGNVITKVLVEYEEYRSMLGLDIDDNTKINYSEPWYELKVDSNNTITIKRLELELYTREEVKILITNAFKAGYERSHSGYPYTDNWSKPKVEEFLKENL